MRIISSNSDDAGIHVHGPGSGGENNKGKAAACSSPHATSPYMQMHMPTQ
jgi:hypothetical protein